MRILWIENHSAFARLATRQFLSAHDVTVVPTVAEARDLLLETEFDAILLDFDLDDGTGTEVLDFLHQHSLTAFVVATSSHDHGNSALLAAGANAVCAKLRFGEIETILARK